MNYIKQLNAFYDWLLLNPISPKEQALYLAILNLNNKCGWKKEFAIANQTLQALCSMAKSDLHKTRNELKLNGLIEYEKGKKGQAGKYMIIPLYETNLETNVETNMETNLETNVEDILKHKQNNKKPSCRKQVYDRESIPYQLADYQLRKIRTYKPDFKEPDLQKWTDDMRLLVNDGRTPEEIKAVIDWVTQDSFWKANVLSPSKLRKQWDQLTLKMGPKTRPKLDLVETTEEQRSQLDEIRRKQAERNQARSS